MPASQAVEETRTDDSRPARCGGSPRAGSLHASTFPPARESRCTLSQSGNTRTQERLSVAARLGDRDVDDVAVVVVDEVAAHRRVAGVAGSSRIRPEREMTAHAAATVGRLRDRHRARELDE